MATIITNIPTRVFPWEVDTIEIKAEQDTAVKIAVGGENIFNATLTPTARKKITIYGLANAINDTEFASSGAETGTLTFYIDGATAATALLIPCRLRLNDPAIEVARSNFLTFASSLFKRIPADAQEALTWWAIDAEETEPSKVKIEALWIRQTDQEVKETKQQLDGEDIGYNYYTANVSPSQLAPPDTADEWQLVKYNVNVNGRQMNYRLALDGLNNSDVTGIKFTNAFGVKESFYFFGSVEKEVKPEYSSAIINGKTVNYWIENKPTWTAQTGPLGKCEELLFNDLCTSKEISLLKNNTPLVITECSFKPTNGWADTNTASLTWQEQTDGETYNVVTPLRTFDNTYDKTYE